MTDWLEDLDHDLIDDHDDDRSAPPPKPQRRDDRAPGNRGRRDNRERSPQGRAPEGRAPEGRSQEGRPARPQQGQSQQGQSQQGRSQEGRSQEGRPQQGRPPQRPPQSRPPQSRPPQGYTSLADFEDDDDDDLTPPPPRAPEGRRGDAPPSRPRPPQRTRDDQDQGPAPRENGPRESRSRDAEPRGSAEGRPAAPRVEAQRPPRAAEQQPSPARTEEGSSEAARSQPPRRRDEEENREGRREGRGDREGRREGRGSRERGGRDRGRDRDRKPGGERGGRGKFESEYDAHDIDDMEAPAPRPKVERTEKTFTGGFSTMGLSAVMMNALADAGYEEPSPIQAGLIPRALAGVDVLGQARTGTGKTASFVVPILEALEPHHAHAAPQAIVLVPTRELAVQVKDEFEKLAVGRNASILAVYGGKPIRQQVERLKRGVEVVVGTPGRVLDHLARGTLQLSSLKLVVLDEADRMLDIGFRPDIEKILRQCPQSRQTLLLSATVPPPVEKLAKRYMREPETMNFSPTDVSADTIEQFYFTVDTDKKFDLLMKLIARENPTQSIIFCRTKRGTEKIHHHLQKKVEGSACIHGDLSQSVRDRVMSAFREGRVKHLVATDVVGRGIDVSNISHIINYDVPAFCDDYVHRVGRTGRMGREGVAYTFVTPEEGGELTRIEMRIDKMLTRDEIEGFETTSKRGREDMAAAQAAAQAASTKYITSDVGFEPESPEGGPPKPPPKKKYRRAL